MKIENYNTYFFFAALAVITVVTFLIFKPFLVAIIIAAILAVIFQSPYQWMVRITGGKHKLSSITVCLLILLIVIIPVFFSMGLVASAIADFSGILFGDGGGYQKIYASIIQKIYNSPFFSALNLQQTLDLKELSGSFQVIGQVSVRIVQAIYQSIASFGFWTFVVFFTLYYLFVDGKRVVDRIMELSPLRNDQEKMLVENFISMSRATIKGTLVVGVIQGVIGGFLFYFTGVTAPAVWGIVMILFAIIPMVGTGIVWGPVGVIMLLTGNIWQGIVILAFGAAVISTIDNILRPKLVGRDTQMHPVMVFFATVGGIFMFGLVGFMIGPILVAFFLTLWGIYAQEFKNQLQKYNA